MGKKNSKKDAAALEYRKLKSKCHVNGIVNAAYTIDELHRNRLDILTIVDELKESTTLVHDGKTWEIEAMLMAQAKTLDVFFNKTLVEVIDTNMINQIQAFADIALRTQNQCRKTLLALADISHPKRATFIKQQNNAINQQVNNADTSPPAISQKTENPANELLEVKPDGQRLDGGTPLAAVTVNPAMEALDAVNRR